MRPYFRFPQQVRGTIPTELKYGYLGFVLILVPAYTWWYGLVNFLWFSNAALLLGLVGVWLESRRLLSMQLVSILLPELVWIAAFTLGLLRSGAPPLGITDYMFDPAIPLFIRGLSLFHLLLPFLLLWLVWRLGYDPRAWRYWVPIGWGILIAAFLLSTPEQNVNFVYHSERLALEIPGGLWLLVVLGLSTLTWALTHALVYWFMAHYRRIGDPAYD